MPRKGRRAQAAKLRWRKPKQEQLPSQSPPDRQSRTTETQPPCSRSPVNNVFVVDFPLRLDCEVSYQDLLRQEYHRISARGGVLLSTEPSLVQQHSIACYGGSVSFSSVLPSGLPALSKAQEASWITPIQTVLEFGGGPFQPDFCGSDISDSVPSETALDQGWAPLWLPTSCEQSGWNAPNQIVLECG
ncbi:hypothetical protein INR49_003215 [Caranx melampygus]|nr:hypothetical protein INR49_003215 [Caranx melampygus]